MLTKNQIIPLEISALSHEGYGVGRHEGIAVFVPGAAPGDLLETRVTKVLARFAYGRIERVSSPSPLRAENDCPAFPRCGGCSLRHIDYNVELAEKQSWVSENLRRIGGVSLEWEPILASPKINRYRNKAQYPVRLVDGRVRTGFFAPRSHRLIPVTDCLLQPVEFAEISDILCRFMDEYGVAPYDEETHSGLIRHLYLRQTANGGIMVCLVINGDSLPFWEMLLERLQAAVPGIRTLLLNHNTQPTNVILTARQTVLFGPGTLTDTLCGVLLEISPLSFYQVNHAAAELLYGQALRYADPQPGDTLLDLYCGAGSIGLSMADRVKALIGVDVIAPAVRNAEKNALRNGIANARFLCADAADAASSLLAEGLRPNIVLLDPPRKGADQQTLRSVVQMSPEKLIYISCNSATLARDCKWLAAHGYRVSAGRAADFFPRTTHVESVVLLERAESM